jgi:anaerobic magnesium-protoporphyrin IX monomethyl ester cyclase
MKISLLQPQTPGTEGWCPPLGLAYLASAIEKEGYLVEIIDLNAESIQDDALLHRISQSDIVGITTTMASQKEALRLMRLLDGIHIVVGGPQASACPEPYLQHHGAIVFAGEAEISLPNYLQEINNGRSGLDTPGIMYLDQDNILVKNPRPPLIQDLNNVAMPARHYFNMNSYTVRLSGQKATNMMSSRGCPFECIFCFHDYLGKIYRPRSAENVIAEMELLKYRYGYDAILFYDDNFTLQKRRVEDICTQLIDHKLNMKWRCYSRVNGVDEKLLTQMHQAGCCEIVFGVESGSQRTLDLSNKGIKVEDSIRTINLCREIGISTKSYIMIGFPWETIKDIEQTIGFLDQILPSQVHVVIVTPFPNTPLEKMLSSQGIFIDEDVDITGISQPSFETGNFTREDLIYYRDLAYEKIRSSNVDHVLSYDWKQDPDWRKQFKRLNHNS